MLKLHCFISGERATHPPKVNDPLFSVQIASGTYLNEICASLSKLALKYEGAVSFMPFKANFFNGDTEIIVEAIHIHGNIDYIWFSCIYKNKRIVSHSVRISDISGSTHAAN